MAVDIALAHLHAALPTKKGQAERDEYKASPLHWRRYQP